MSSKNNPTTLGRRKQKIYEDILGRQIKTETFEWNGSTVYSTTTHTYNGRDQITATTQYAGTTSGTARQVTMSYDGHGRMATRHYPIEDTSANTSWTYNADDSIATVTDPRGVVTNFSYYSTTGLLNQIAYTVPSGQASTVDDTPDVTFAYDNLGNRTSMTDGTGSTVYGYNELSQMTTETKTFTGITGSFPIDYTYNISGSLKTMSDPQISTTKVVFDRDKIGRVIGADFSVQATSTNYIHGAKYRAWGDLKEYKYDWHYPTATAETFFNFSYDNRLQVSSYESGRGSQSAGSTSFQRFADGKVKKVSGTAIYSEILYSYDHLGRAAKGYTGTDADPNSPTSVGPFKQDISYNQFSEVTAITGKLWGTNMPSRGTSYDLATGRLPNMSYDAAGNIVSERIQSSPTVINRTLKYDAAGRQVESYDPRVHTCCENNHTFNTYYDGNGWKVKGTDLSAPPSGPSSSTTSYEIRSTVLGGETVGTYTPYPENPASAFIVPVLGGKLTYSHIENYSDSVGFTRTGPKRSKNSAGICQLVFTIREERMSGPKSRPTRDLSTAVTDAVTILGYTRDAQKAVSPFPAVNRRGSTPELTRFINWYWLNGKDRMRPRPRLQPTARRFPMNRHTRSIKRKPSRRKRAQRLRPTNPKAPRMTTVPCSLHRSLARTAQRATVRTL